MNILTIIIKFNYNLVTLLQLTFFCKVVLAHVIQKQIANSNVPKLFPSNECKLVPWYLIKK